MFLNHIVNDNSDGHWRVNNSPVTAQPTTALLFLSLIFRTSLPFQQTFYSYIIRGPLLFAGGAQIRTLVSGSWTSAYLVGILEIYHLPVVWLMVVTHLKVMSFVLELRFLRLTWTVLGRTKGGRRKSKGRCFPSETSGSAAAAFRSQGQSRILMSLIVLMEQTFESLGPNVSFQKSSRWFWGILISENHAFTGRDFWNLAVMTGEWKWGGDHYQRVLADVRGLGIEPG